MSMCRVGVKVDEPEHCGHAPATMRVVSNCDPMGMGAGIDVKTCRYHADKFGETFIDTLIAYPTIDGKPPVVIAIPLKEGE